MAITVTATQGTDTFNGIALTVKVLTGAVEAGGASNTFHVSPGTGPAAVSLTPNASSSLLVFSTTIDTAFTFTAAANNTYDNNSTAPFGVGVGDGHYTGTVTSGVAVTVGSSAPTVSDHYNCAAYEIRPSGGSTPVLDGSAPAQATTSTAITVTSGSFSPPPGAVLVACIESFASGAGSGQTMTVSDTSGLAWTQRAALSYANQSEAVFIFTATVPAAAAPAQARPGKTWLRRFHHRQARPAATAATTISGTATLTGAGIVADTPVTLIAPASPAGAGTAAALVTESAGAAAAGAGTLAANVTQGSTVAAAGGGTVTAAVTQGASAAVTGAGSASSAVTEIAPASIAGAGTVNGAAAQGANSNLAGAGTLNALVTEIASAGLTGAGVVSASVGGNVSGTAGITGAGTLTALAAQSAPAAPAGAGSVTAAATLRVTAALAAAGALTATGTGQPPNVKAASTASVTAAAVSTAAVADPRDGTAAVTATGTAGSILDETSSSSGTILDEAAHVILSESGGTAAASAAAVTNPRDGTAAVTATAASAASVT